MCAWCAYPSTPLVAACPPAETSVRRESCAKVCELPSSLLPLLPHTGDRAGGCRLPLHRCQPGRTAAGLGRTGEGRAGTVLPVGVEFVCQHACRMTPYLFFDLSPAQVLWLACCVRRLAALPCLPSLSPAVDRPGEACVQAAGKGQGRASPCALGTAGECESAQSARADLSRMTCTCTHSGLLSQQWHVAFELACEYCTAVQQRRRRFTNNLNMWRCRYAAECC